MDGFALVWQVLEQGWPAALLVAVVVLWRLLNSNLAQSRTDMAKLQADHHAEILGLVSRYEAIAENVLATQVEYTTQMRDVIAPTIERNTAVQASITSAIEMLTAKIESQNVAERRHEALMQALQHQQTGDR